ncbi:hypothetical protein OIDMADRAFT_17066 [Oidiodendron maius Zn]|uniref:Uncharacterized protein n=1 Tax=Oidiodendron maius (strain Zn) TaxID=913774 RepID=A0A0C3HUI6_OIDMZ|nr:hypothetical protein OIDMADRAFT_17066 [Oidiodendron maius Zn]
MGTIRDQRSVSWPKSAASILTWHALYHKLIHGLQVPSLLYFLLHLSPTQQMAYQSVIFVRFTSA